jgi:hypothetical protein
MTAFNRCPSNRPGGETHVLRDDDVALAFLETADLVVVAP